MATDRLVGLAVQVAVADEVECGKSSLVNVLLGIEVAQPGAAADHRPHRWWWGGGGHARLRGRLDDGRVEPHPLGRWRGFVSEDANPGNRLGRPR